MCRMEYSPPREEGWLRHQENVGEAHLSAADGVVAHKSRSGVTDHPGRCRGHPSLRGGDLRSLKKGSHPCWVRHPLKKSDPYVNPAQASSEFEESARHIPAECE